MDVFTPEKRSYVMSKIHGKDTRGEVLVRKGLFSLGFRFRKNDKRYPGRPDIVLPKYRTVIFVNGCFWHGHEGCRYFVMPQSEFWKEKIEKNKERDERNIASLIASGWRVIVIWECALGRKEDFVSLVQALADEIRKGKNSYVSFPDDEVRSGNEPGISPDC